MKKRTTFMTNLTSVVEAFRGMDCLQERSMAMVEHLCLVSEDSKPTFWVAWGVRLGWVCVCGGEEGEV